MHKIYIPQSNPNDEYVFLAEWKFENNQLVKKGDHLLSVETSKVVEENAFPFMLLKLVNSTIVP